MNSVVDLIDKIRKTPFILGRPTVRNLYMFLSGFAYARKGQSDDYHVLSEFGSFVHLRFEISSAQSWAGIIQFFSVSETEEMKLFWELWDEFCAQQNRQKTGKNGAPVLVRSGRKRRA